jgi:hypothetical protein
MMSPLLSGELSEVAPRAMHSKLQPSIRHLSARAPTVPQARCLVPSSPPTLLA